MKVKRNKLILIIVGTVLILGVGVLMRSLPDFSKSILGYVEPGEKRMLMLKQELVFEESVYRLYSDKSCGGFGDFGWQIYKINNNSITTNFSISCESDLSDIGVKSDILNLILTNYSEDGTDTRNPKIDIIDGKYLTFSRGGILLWFV